MTEPVRRRRTRRPAAPEKEPMQADTPSKRRCKAPARTTEDQCGNPPMLGQEVCRMHGGSSPQAKDAARRRLNAMAEPAMAVLDKILRDEKVPPRDRVRVALGLLDRTGYGPSSRVEVDTPWEAVVMGVVADEGQKPAEWRQRRYEQYDPDEDPEYDEPS